MKCASDNVLLAFCVTLVPLRRHRPNGRFGDARAASGPFDATERIPDPARNNCTGDSAIPTIASSSVLFVASWRACRRCDRYFFRKMEMKTIIREDVLNEFRFHTVLLPRQRTSLNKAVVISKTCLTHALACAPDETDGRSERPVGPDQTHHYANME